MFYFVSTSPTYRDHCANWQWLTQASSTYCLFNVRGSLKFQKIRHDNVRHRNFMAISQTIWLDCVVAVKTMMTIIKLHRSTLKRQIYQNIIFPTVICQIRERKRKILIDFEAASSISSATG